MLNLSSVRAKLRGAYRGLPDFILVPFGIGTVVAVFGVVILLVVALAAIFAVGFDTAWGLYATQWRNSLLIAALVPFLMTALAVVVVFVLVPLRRALLRLLPVLSKVGEGTVSIVVIFGLLAFLAAETAKHSNKRVAALRTGADPSAPQTTAALVNRQQAAITEASANASALLTALDATELEIGLAKAQMRSTLTTLTEQQRALASSSATLADLNRRQVVLQGELTVIQTALGGRQPIALDDLNAASRWGQVQGFVIGIITGLISPYLKEMIDRWRGRRRRSRQTPDES